MKKAAFFLLTAFLLTPYVACAQEPDTTVPAAPPSTALPVPATPENLFEALPNLRWDPATQGTLLLVAPQVIIPPKPEKPFASAANGYQEPPSLPDPVPPELVSGVYRTRDLLEYFGCRQVRLRGLTVFAPATMVVLNTKFGKPDLYARMRMEEKFRILQATLTPEQWKQLASAGGLGKENLQGEQRELFEAMLPNPLVYQVSTVGGVIEETGEGKRKTEPPVRKTLTSGQRSGIRLRMTRDTYLFLPSANPASPYNIGILPREATGTQRLSVYEVLPRRPRSSFGAVLSENVPSRLKSGQIDFDADALNAPITLDDAVTVEDLINRIRAATRIDIYADRRLARLPIVLRAVPGTQVRAGEVLKALCWGVTGAVRHVRESDESAGVFILTDDIEGLGSRFSALTEWTQGASSARYEMGYRLDRIIRRQKALDEIGFAPEDNFAPNTEQNAKIEKAWAKGQTRFLGVTFPMTILPPDLQERARQSAFELNALRAKQSEGGQVRKVSEDSVNLSVQIGLRLEVPELGVIPMGMLSDGGLDSLLPEADYTDPLKPPAKTITLPPSLKIGGVLSVTPTDETEARGAVRAARRQGLKQVWVAAAPSREDASSDSSDPEFLRILRAAIGEAALAGETPVSVLAIARVLTVPRQIEPDKKTDLLLDRNVSGLGETAALRNRLELARVTGEDPKPYEKTVSQSRDWLLPDAPGVASRVTKRLAALAATPGLAGVVLADLMAPGYRSFKESRYIDSGNYSYLGYTPQRRVAAIRTLGYDPIDIELERGYISYDAPGPTFFDDAVQQAAQKAVPKTAEQKKALADAAQKGDLAAQAENNPAVAWNAFRFRAASSLASQVYQTLLTEAKRKASPFAVYLQAVSWGEPWFGSWDQPDKLPQELDFNDDDRNGSVRLERSAHAASKTVLYRQSFVPSEDPNDPQSTTDTPPVPPAEKYAFDFNRQYERGNKTWDGYVFDLRDLPWSKAQDVLKSLAPSKTGVR